MIPLLWGLRQIPGMVDRFFDASQKPGARMSGFCEASLKGDSDGRMMREQRSSASPARPSGGAHAYHLPSFRNITKSSAGAGGLTDTATSSKPSRLKSPTAREIGSGGVSKLT